MKPGYASTEDGILSVFVFSDSSSARCCESASESAFDSPPNVNVITCQKLLCKIKSEPFKLSYTQKKSHMHTGSRS